MVFFAIYFIVGTPSKPAILKNSYLQPIAVPYLFVALTPDLKTAKFTGENADTLRLIKYDRVILNQEATWKNGPATTTLTSISLSSLTNRLEKESSGERVGNSFVFEAEEHYTAPKTIR